MADIAKLAQRAVDAPTLTPSAPEALRRRAATIRRRQRLVTTGAALAAVVVGSSVWAVSSEPGPQPIHVTTSPTISKTTSTTTPPPVTPAGASRRQIAAFVAAARSDGSFSATYAVDAGGRANATTHRSVVVVQRSPDDYSYRSTPPLAQQAPSSTVASSAVYVTPHGYFSCNLPRGPRAHWSCEQDVGMGMGGMFLLIGPYPPSDLALAVQNAVYSYNLAPGEGGVPKVSAHLSSRTLSGQRVRCLTFGPIAFPTSSACINAMGLIVSYQIPTGVSVSSTYTQATMVSFAPNPPAADLDLPAAPAP